MVGGGGGRACQTGGNGAEGEGGRGDAHHKSDGRPASLQHSVCISVDGVDCVVLRCGGAVVGAIAGGQHPKVVAMQVEGMLLCAVARSGAVGTARCSADNKPTS